MYGRLLKQKLKHLPLLITRAVSASA